jgi:endonuclease-3
MSRTPEILEILKETYPHAKIVLNYGNNWELLVSVILSAQCTDKKVNEVTAKLFKKYPALDDYVNANPAEFEQDIRQTGFYRNKSKNILTAAKMVKGKFTGKLPKTMAEMLTIPGVARKTANVVLGNAYGIVDGIAVDTHVLRLSQRLRLINPDQVGPGKKPHVIPAGHVIPANHVIPAKAGIHTNNFNRFRIKSGMTLDYYKDASPEKIELALMKIIPKEDWFKTTYWLIDHGRAICKAQNPDCPHCPLNRLCPASRYKM